MDPQNLLKYTTINVKGLLHSQLYPNKLQTHLDRFAREKMDIIFLQETHVHTKQIAEKITRNWAGESYFSYGTSRARGVGILTSERIKSCILEDKTKIKGISTVVLYRYNSNF